MNEIKELIFDACVFIQDNNSDANTMLNILRFLDGKEKPITDNSLIRQNLLPDVINAIQMRCEVEGIDFLNDEEMDSMVGGDLYEYMANTYLKLYIEANYKNIKHCLDNWESTKTFLESHLEEQ